MFKNAIVRKPCPEMTHGLTTASLGMPDYQLALEQHAKYTEVLLSYFNTAEVIHTPGTLDAGDVMMTGRHFYIGISEPTNPKGADQLIRILEKFNSTGEKVPLFEMFQNIKNWMED